MTTYNTGNPLGSTDPRDLYDNAENFDEAVNSEESQWVDRFGRPRLPLMEQERQFVSDQERREGEFQADQSSREAVFSDFLQASGYQDLGEYSPGIEITAHNQYVTFGGQPYTLKPSIPVPYTTSGEWTGDDFKLIGDGSLRQDLANPDKGAAMVARGVVAVDSIADLLALPEGQRQEGLRYLVKEYHAGTGVGGGEFYWSASRGKADHDGGQIIDPIHSVQPGAVGWWSSENTTNGVYVRLSKSPYDLHTYGVVGDGITDATNAITAMATAAGEGGEIVIPEGIFIYSSGVSTLPNQVWRWLGKMKLVGPVGGFSGASLSVKSGVVLINPRIDENYQNNDVSGLGSKYTLGMYGSTNVIVFGGKLSNARHNFVQWGSNSKDISFYGVTFDSCTEHCIYSSDVSTALGDSENSSSRGIRFFGCEFKSPGADTTQLEAHFVKHRGCTDIAYTGCTFNGVETSASRFVLNLENSSNVRFYNCSAAGMNHFALFGDAESFNVLWDGGILDKRVGSQLAFAAIAAFRANSNFKINNATIYNATPCSQTSGGVSLRNCTIYLPANVSWPVQNDIYVENLNIQWSAASTIDRPIRVTGSGVLRAKNSKLTTNGAAGLSILLDIADGGKAVLDGFELPDWNESRGVYVRSTAGNLQIFKGIVLPDSNMSAAAISLNNYSGDALIGECIVRNGGIQIDGGVTAVQYGNITS